MQGVRDQTSIQVGRKLAGTSRKTLQLAYEDGNGGRKQIDVSLCWRNRSARDGDGTDSGMAASSLLVMREIYSTSMR